MNRERLPQTVIEIMDGLVEAGFEAYLVGGCVRDMVLDRAPKDWDIATNARPQEIQKIFPESVYENEFGTVGVKTGDEQYPIVEITTYRAEGRYTDKRHPDEVRFAKTIEEDLSRRDFTANAMALGFGATGDMQVIDPYGGRDDLGRRLIRTVGDPKQRFDEDALRLMRAVRFATELGWDIEGDTRRAMETVGGNLEMIAQERIRDELVKIVMADEAVRGITLLEEMNLLRIVLPELREGLGVGQNKHHIYSVFEHNLRSLDYAARQGYSLIVRMASLLHDVGKPKTKRGEGPDSTFYNHAQVGARMALRALDRLRFPKVMTEAIVHLVRHHMFYYNIGEVTDAGIRRFVRRVGAEYIDDLIKLREADRIGSGVAKAVPYKLRHFLFMIEKVKHDPLSPSMLALDGTELMALLQIAPGPRVGWILNALLEEVLDDPAKNIKENLEARSLNLAKLTDEELKEISEKAKETKIEYEDEREADIKRKFHVQ